MKKNLVILIPGIGYPVTQPLFYYTAHLASIHGYDIEAIDLSHIKDYSPGRTTAQIEAIQEALSFCVEHLKKTDYSGYEHILIVSKDAGCIIAAHCVSNIDALSRHPNLSHIFFAPIVPAFAQLHRHNGLVFAGSADPYAPIAEVRSLAEESGLTFHELTGADQCLEAGTVAQSLQALTNIMQRIEDNILSETASIYDFRVRHPEKGEVPLLQFKGEVLLIVNTATGCGFTPQYETLEYLYDTYHKDGFTVLDFPCDQFGHQAPGSDTEIHNFCTSRYNITYPQFSKIDVNGAHEIPLYTFLKQRQGFHGFDMNKKEGVFLDKKLSETDPHYAESADIKWNFTKFLVTRHGNVIARFEPTDDLTALEEAIKAAL